jgi:diguanylate cyclase (GGDEF)-like protein
MSRRTWRIDIMKDDPGADGEMSRASGSRPSKDDESGRVEAGIEPVTASPGPSGFRRCRDSIVRMGRAAWARSFGESRARFEVTLHRIVAELKEAGSPDAVEAALLRLARELAPTSRVGLIRTADEAADQTGHGPVVEQTEDEAERPVQGWTRRPDETVDDVPLNCGVASHGRLRLFTPGGGRSAPRPETLRRLATACTMAAFALENLRRDAEWAWQGRDEAGEDSRSCLSETRSTSEARDATFLNAVLPFALSQAKRHREPVSLLCLGIDRLAAIQDLLGHEVAERLVQNVARTVSSLVRSSDIVARLDDNRIVVLLVRARGPSASSIAQIICRAMTEPTRNVPELPSATVSIGVAEFPTDARTAFSLLDASDDALARAQRRGQNQVVLAEARPVTAPSSGSPTTAQPASCTC